MVGGHFSLVLQWLTHSRGAINQDLISPEKVQPGGSMKGGVGGVGAIQNMDDAMFQFLHSLHRNVYSNR